ncbi:DUF2849 domain-containing protein [Hyphomonas sp. FCG-A18]|jgi:hypothetical protein|uniref:DUF2849 domain-containing protein n=1 Tax=Hyphomonas sp. FCG-A18 TaxID=3080019 RepID=UPI002B313115|nr:DUF2849 domain-containing protein [Hyphomonas sp. FCG-A18]
MTSVRPKLKPETPKAITAWRTRTGQNVWMTADRGWSEDPADIAAFTGDEAEEALAHAKTQEGNVTDPYFMEVTADGKIAGRETLRESIRANGPTVPYGIIV